MDVLEVGSWVLPASLTAFFCSINFTKKFILKKILKKDLIYKSDSGFNVDSVGHDQC